MTIRRRYEIVWAVFVPHRLLCVLTAAVTLTPIAASASQVTSLSDGFGTPSLPSLITEVQAELPYLQTLYCGTAAAARHTLTLATALRNANTYVVRHSTRAARRAFANSRSARTERGSLAAAAAASAANAPVGALDALLHAHHLAPRDPMPLINAAPVLTAAKKPNEALALLAAAAKLPAPAHQPWGLPTRALIANNRGYALLALNRWADATTTLEAAKKAAPQLAEAELNLAVADVCANKPAAAARMMFFGVRRDPSVAGDLVEGESSYPTPTQAHIDITHGAKITLPTYSWPKDMATGNAMAQAVEHDMVAAEQRELNLINKENQLSAQLGNELQNANAATRHRTQNLVAIARFAGVDPTLSSLSDAADALDLRLEDLSSTRLGQAADCSGGGSTHSMWVGLLNKYDAALRSYIKASYQLETAAGANLRNSTAHQLVMTNASDWAQSHVVLLLQQANFLTMWDDQCTPKVGPGDSDPVNDPTDKRPPSPSCPTGLQGKGWQLNIGPVQVSVDCETVAAEIDTGGWIGAFGNASHNFRDGSTTIFAGPRAKANPGPWGPNVNFKDGLYMTFDSSGQVQDMGARVETGSEINLGPAGGATFSGDRMDFSIVGAVPSAAQFTF